MNIVGSLLLIAFVTGNAFPNESTYCPLCHMNVVDAHGVDLGWHVSFAYGQRIHTCDMHTGAEYKEGLQKFSHPNHMAYAMKEYVVDDSNCQNECELCEEELRDPITGELITTENFQYVCVKYGQKLYFASNTSKTTYLNRINVARDYLVANISCGGEECVDAFQLPATSNSDNSPSSTSSDEFCVGASAMFNGFQTTGNGKTCVLLLFQPFVLSSALKYALGFIGTFFAAIVNESLVKYREKARKHFVKLNADLGQTYTTTSTKFKLSKLYHKSILALLYMIQMTLAYFLMLVVMTYETGLFISLILGFGAGFLLFKNVDEKPPAVQSVARRLSEIVIPPNAIILEVDGMMCMKNCGNTVQNALLSVDGVKQANVLFRERKAIVVGCAPPAELIDAIETVGFSARVADAPQYSE